MEKKRKTSAGMYHYQEVSNVVCIITMHGVYFSKPLIVIDQLKFSSKPYFKDPDRNYIILFDDLWFDALAKLFVTL